MKKSGRHLLLAGVAAFVLTLPLNLPASFVYAHIADHMPPGLAWRAITGTLLEPHVHHVSAELPYGSTLVIDELVFEFRLLPLLTGRLGVTFELKIADDRITGEGSLGPRRWRVDTIDGNLKVASIVSRLPVAELAVSSGQIELSGEQWSGRYDYFPDSGTMHIRALHLQSDLAGPAPLGDYDINLNLDPQGLNGQVSTSGPDSPLNISAVVTLDPAVRQWQVEGSAATTVAAAESVRGLLPFLGAVENNQAHIRFQTTY